MLGGLGVILCHILMIMVPLFIVFKERWIFILVCLAVIIIISIFIIYDTQVTDTSLTSLADCRRREIRTLL